MPVDVKGNLNKFYSQARGDIASLIAGSAVGSAVIFNGTEATVNFFVYNYVDTVHWVSAQKTMVAAGKSGTVAASGTFYKIHPNDAKDEEYLVSPGKAYIYHGPGNFESV